MVLRDLEGFDSWIERESPSVVAQRAVRHFLAEVGVRSWRSPSVPIESLSGQPDYEMRTVTLAIEGEDPVQIWYYHHYASDAVDIVAITHL